MRPKFSTRFAIKMVGFMVILPTAAIGQDCSMKLSTFEPTSKSYSKEVNQLSAKLVDLFDQFSDIDSAASSTPEECPAGLEDSRAKVEALGWQDLLERSDELLDCGHFFSHRVLTDVERAKASNDGQLILRLGTIQQRIFKIEQNVTEAAKQATFLGLRAEGLLNEHNALKSRCDLLGDIYE